MSNVDFSRYSKRIVQLFWDPEPRNDNVERIPIWCLGRRYENKHQSNWRSDTHDIGTAPVVSLTTNAQSPAGSRDGFESNRSSFEQIARVIDEPVPAIQGGEMWPEEFLDDFEARIWLTYRSNFPPIPKSPDPKAASGMSLSVRLKSQLAKQSGFTSDTGWGCMIRSGQSLLANALALSWLGRDRTRLTHQAEEKRLLALFADDPRAPFSIHKFVEHGAAACGTFPGQWFGPSATAKCIQALSNNCPVANLKVLVTGDGPDVYEDQILRTAKSGTTRFQPTLLLVGTRLGIDRITPVYWDALKTALQLPQSVGIAGGRPSSSHYFVGSQGQQFFYLDPHQTRPVVPFHENPADYTLEEMDSYHTRRLRRIPVEEMDPSMLIAFLFRDEEDWRSWRRAVSEAPGKAIFHVANSEPLRYGYGTERESALDEVETFDDDTDEVDDRTA